MKEYFKDYSFDDWIRLPKEKQIDIINSYWDPFDPTIGRNTKAAIIENFLKTLDNESIRQVGIKNFGFYSVELFVITDNSKLRIPSHFGGLIINKGVVEQQIKGNKHKIKWKYHGHDDMDLTEKIIIR